jgi:hypothetical protein
MLPLFIASAVLFTTCLVTWIVLDRYIKRVHPELWTPAAGGLLYKPNIIRTFWPQLVFIFSGGHRRLNDPLLSAMIWGYRIQFTVYSIVWIVLTWGMFAAL